MATMKKTAKKAPAKKSTTEKASAKNPVKKASAQKMGRLSAIDAAANVLGESKEPLNCKQMVEAMAVTGYWKNPGGKTRWATLYSALLREINMKRKDSRFKKTEQRKFAVRK